MGYGLKINGVKIKEPPVGGFSISHYNLTKSGRVSSGKMTMELVAKKRKFFFKYPVISAADKKVIMDIIDGTDMFMNFEYIEDGVHKSAIVYVGEISNEGFRAGGLSGWYWKNFEFNLIEQ